MAYHLIQGSFPKKEMWELNSGAPLETAPCSSALGARIEVPRRREGWGGWVGRVRDWVWGWGVPSPLGFGESPEKIDFGSQIGEFWCKLGPFYTVHLKLV